MSKPDDYIDLKDYPGEKKRTLRADIEDVVRRLYDQEFTSRAVGLVVAKIPR